MAKKRQKIDVRAAFTKDNQVYRIAFHDRPLPPLDLVNHPPHYTAGAIEHIAYVEDREGWMLGYCMGNTTKYLHRAGLKGGEDQLTPLLKARWYLDRYIKFLEKKLAQEKK